MEQLTAKELAKKLGISAAAVSLALNGKDGVSKKTREIVLKSAIEHGMRLPQNNDTKNSSQSKTICYLVITDSYVKSGEHSMFESCVLYGVDTAAQEIGYNTLVKYIDVKNILNQSTIELVTNVDGLIILATDVNSETASDMRKLMDITKDIPKVIIDTMILAGEEDSIGNDNFSGGALAVKSLLRSGCKTIGYLKSKTRLLNFDEREAGLINELSKNNLSLFTTLDIGLSSTDAYTDVENWLNENPSLPDAFFADNDVLAIAALRAIKSAGYSVPNDVSIIGFDDIPIATMCEPSLSTIKCSKEDLGISAVYSLQTKINLNPNLSKLRAISKTYMTPSFINRGTTR